MLQQIVDLREEGDELHAFPETLGDEVWGLATPFKSWTVWDVVAHLHFSDALAVLAVKDPDGFVAEVSELASALMGGTDLRGVARDRLGGLSAAASCGGGGRVFCRCANSWGPWTRSLG